MFSCRKTLNTIMVFSAANVAAFFGERQNLFALAYLTSTDHEDEVFL